LEGAREDLVRLIGGREVAVVLGLAAGAPLVHMLRRPWGRRSLAVMATATIALVIICLAWAVSTRSSVWVFRYLGVAVPSVLVLGALGLGRAGRLGMAALALIAFLAAPVADKGPLQQKSNMRGLAMKVASRLLPGDLVIAPTGEMPLLAFYLPKGPRFSTTSGPVRDARVADWRDVTERLRDNDPRVILAPAIDGVVPGGHVLVVCPRTGVQVTDFGRLNARRCDDTLALVLADPRFSLEMVVTPPAGVGVSPVEGHLLTRRA
jgi:MFS family permease